MPEGPCGRQPDDSVVCFSYGHGSTYDAFDVPGATSSWVVVPLELVDGGSPDQACALGTDRALTCSAALQDIPDELPTGYSFTTLSTGNDHLCGVTIVGEVVCAVFSAARDTCPFCTELYRE